MKKQITIGLLMAFVVLFTACTSNKKPATEQKEITIAMVNWIECIADTHLAKVVLEEKGYKVNLVNADVALVFSAVANGDADIFLEVWEPVTHKPYLEKYGDKIEYVGTLYDQGRIGLVVPQYMPINTIEELQGAKDKLDGKIVGINPGAGMMKLTEDAIRDYKLDLELVTSSEAGMLAALKRAYDRKEWVVVTGWKPHTKFTRFDLKILSDSKGIYGDAESISSYATKGWSAANPEVATFFKKFKMNDDMMGSLMIAIEGNPGKEDEAARIWYKEHKTVVDSWFVK